MVVGVPTSFVKLKRRPISAATVDWILTAQLLMTGGFLSADRFCLVFRTRNR